jgi:hypothetical protein
MTRVNAPISEASFQDAIYDWIDAFLPLWSGVGDRNGKPMLTWHMQQAPRPTTPMIMARISVLRGVGMDYFSQPRAELIDEVTKLAVQQSGTREFTLYLEYFGPDAISQLSKIKDNCLNTWTAGPLESAGICIFDSGNILDAHAFMGTVPEERALLEIQMRTSISNIITQLVNIIEKVIITGAINAGVDISLDTITIDTITV